jgi:hypothetical protein
MVRELIAMAYKTKIRMQQKTFNGNYAHFPNRIFFQAANQLLLIGGNCHCISYYNFNLTNSQWMMPFGK